MAAPAPHDPPTSTDPPAATSVDERPVHVTHVRVPFADVDMMRHVNNVAYVRYFETARMRFLVGLLPDHPMLDADARGFSLILAETRIVYRSPAFYDEELVVRCTIGEIRRSAFEMPFTITAGDRLVAEGAGWLVGFDYAQQAAVPLPDDVRAALRG
ncbi:MAG: acyl-CoA thioesterase [Solirubrobacteraceae bacterium]|nr:acyl-CoA thioesterase [Solirubrobacteraceae bacterium]